MTVGAAVVGFGWWGRLLAAQAQENGFSVVGVVDSDPGAAAAAAERGHAVWSSLEEVLEQDEVEAVFLCTPHVQHHAQLLAVIAAGRHVFCEKPFCTDVDEVTEVLSLAAARDVVVGVGHERRFEPPVRDLLARARAGELGELLVVEGNFSQDKFLDLDRDHWRFDPVVSPVGPLSATGIHLVDLSVALLGEPVEVLARLSTRGSDFPNGDTLSMTLGFASGATATLNASLATPFMGRLAVLGSTGWHEVVDHAHPESPQGWTVTRQPRGAERSIVTEPPASSVGANLAAFAAAVEGRGAYPVPRQEIAWTVAAYDAVVRSVASEKVVQPAPAGGWENRG